MTTWRPTLRPASSAPSDQRPVIVVADPDPIIRSTLTASLNYLGYDAKPAVDGASAGQLVDKNDPALLISEVGLGDVDGFTLVRRLRLRGNVFPVLFLSDRVGRDDRLTGLDLGRGDFVAKPFDLDEVVLRVSNLVNARSLTHTTVWRYADVILDEDRHEVWRGRFPILLTPNEFEVLRFLLINPNLVMSRAQILQAVWGYDFGGDFGVVNSCIRHLRRKLGDHPQLIVTVRGYGYTLRMPRTSPGRHQDAAPVFRP